MPVLFVGMSSWLGIINSDSIYRLASTVCPTCSVGAEAFMAALLPRLRTANNGQGPIMPFELEVMQDSKLLNFCDLLNRSVSGVSFFPFSFFS
jgi:hypothetical protein